MDTKLMDAIKSRAKQLYDSRLPYHNFEHALSVMEQSKIILERCHQKKVEVQDEVVYLAALFHDAGYAENHTAKGFDTKEAYSAHLAGEVLSEFSIDSTTIERVQEAIRGTQQDASFASTEERAVRAADLSLMALDFATFKENAIKLKKEYEWLSGQPISWDQWKTLVEKNIGYYLQQDIHITSDPSTSKSGQSEFHKKTRDNLAKLLSSDEG